MDQKPPEFERNDDKNEQDFSSMYSSCSTCKNENEHRKKEYESNEGNLDKIKSYSIEDFRIPSLQHESVLESLLSSDTQLSTIPRVQPQTANIESQAKVEETRTRKTNLLQTLNLWNKWNKWSMKRAKNKLKKLNNFLKLPPEMYFHIFKYLPQKTLLKCRRLSKFWCLMADSFIQLDLVLDSKRFKSLLTKGIQISYLRINEVQMCDMILPLKSKHFKRLSSPKIVEFQDKISSRNFLKMMNAWRSIQHLIFNIESLTSSNLFKRWRHHYQYDYFPQLHSLNMYIDRYHLFRIDRFSTKLIRYNLDQLLMNEYTKLQYFSFEIYNIGNHTPCPLLAPIFLFIGRQHKSLKEVVITFHTGLEYEIHPRSLEDIHGESPELEHELYVHGISQNFPKLELLQLNRIEMHLPSIYGCHTKYRSCDYAQDIIFSPGNTINELIIETLHGISPFMVDKIVQKNWLWLTEIDLTVAIKPPIGDEFLDMNIFSQCSSLTSLRLKKTGHPEVRRIFFDSIQNISALPKSLIKLSIIKFHLDLHTIARVVEDLDKLQCLVISWCTVYAVDGEEMSLPNVFSRMLSCSHLRYINYAPLTRAIFNKTKSMLETNEEVVLIARINKWHWEEIENNFLLYKPKKMIFFKNFEDAQRTWFGPLVYEKVKI